MWRGWGIGAGLALLAAAGAAAGQGAGPAAPAGTIVERRWLALDAVDVRARVPFNANAPFLKYLLDRGAAPPKAGEVVKGDRAEAAWRPVEAKEDGTVEDENGTWFHATVEAPAEPAERVYLAHLDGASTLFVNGAGFVGDVYRGGFGPVPVALRAGTNRVFVAAPRGPWRLRFEPWAEGRSPILAEDATLPDFVEEAVEQGECAVRLVQPSLTWSPEPWIGTEGLDGPPDPPPPVGSRPRQRAPLWTEKVAFDALYGTRRNGTGKPVDFRVQAHAWSGERLGSPVAFRIEVRKPGEARRVTLRSGVDGSVQTYAVLPPSESVLRTNAAVVLTLHGAGVDALGQARSYSPKRDFVIVAPTNRRPFGFDWQDWGRSDAYAAMRHAIYGAFRGVDPVRVFLTGHSMGGHGVWHLAANDPDFWAAIAPSAGWCSFDTYGAPPRPETPLTPIWRGADGGSRTESLVSNLVPIPTFVLHGTKDDNVPLSEATAMIERIEKAGGKPARHFQEGAGHWWDGDASPGVDCVDWPGIFDLFRAHRRREGTALPERTWVSADPAVDSTDHGDEALQPLEYGKPLRIRRPEGTVHILETGNIRRLSLLVGPVADAGKDLEVDGQRFPARGEGGRLRLVRGEEGWVPAAGDPPSGEKSPSRSGPFKRAFDNRFVLVVGTKGTEEENREMLELARWHATTWWYRADGSAPLVRDSDLLADPKAFAGRNLVLYGNADSNAAWRSAIPEGGPVDARRGEVRLGERTWKGGNLGAVFVRPRAGDGRALVGAFASTGARGTRLGYGLIPFTSGVGYPDYAVFGEEFLRSGDGGVLAAGWFDHAWAIQAGGFARE